MRKQYWDARHNCTAMIIGRHGEITRCSDDGEPSGTAGRPMLDVLKDSGITDILLTVTRYFGGTLLGTGGLVKAYGECAKSVIAKAIEENAVEELVEKTEFCFSCDYGLYETLKRQIKDFKLYDVQESYSDTVTLKGKILSEQFKTFSDKIKNISSGKIIL